MGSRFLKSSVMLAGVLAMTIAGSSMVFAAERITAKVSFPFIVHDVELPAGDYVVRDISDGAGVLEIGSADGRHSVMVNTISASSGNNWSEPKLTFTEYEGRHFLATITDGDGNTRQIQLDPAIMAREVAAADEHAK